MKKMKKLLSLVLSVAMVVAMGVTVFADTPNTCKITAPKTNHQYEIYQIFTGDLANGVLSNIKWGTNGKETAGEAVNKAVLDELTALDSKANDRAKLNVIEKYAKLSNPVATITNGETYTAAAGYYLIKDKDNTVSGTDSYTTYIVEVVGNTTITPKSDVPSFEKKVKDTNDTEETTSDWQDSADYDIGDKVPFKLEGTVGQKYADYKQYYFAFHDVEESGLTFNADSVKVYVDNTDITDRDVYTVKKDNLTDGCTFEVIFNNLKNISEVKAGSKIRVEYTSTLNENAELGNQGNLNKAKLEFSNNPNEEQNGTNKPSTGDTPWDNVIVFTYKVVVNKYANSVAEGNKLTGAEFTLTKKLKGGKTKDIAVVKSEDGTSFTFKGLDDGEYILTETKTPARYNTIAPITFTVTADHKITWDGSNRTKVLKSLSGTAKSGEITLTANEDKSQLATDVINKSGSLLPSTGGIGTTIFYVIGGILMVGAGVILVSRRRRSK